MSCETPLAPSVLVNYENLTLHAPIPLSADAAYEVRSQGAVKLGEKAAEGHVPSYYAYPQGGGNGSGIEIRSPTEEAPAVVGRLSDLPVEVVLQAAVAEAIRDERHLLVGCDRADEIVERLAIEGLNTNHSAVSTRIKATVHEQWRWNASVISEKLIRWRNVGDPTSLSSQQCSIAKDQLSMWFGTPDEQPPSWVFDIVDEFQKIYSKVSGPVPRAVGLTMVNSDRDWVRDLGGDLVPEVRSGS